MGMIGEIRVSAASTFAGEVAKSSNVKLAADSICQPCVWSDTYVSPDEMQAGRVYFALQYLDRDLLVPHLYPLIFLGHDLDNDQRDIRFFQHFDSYMAGVRYANHSEEDEDSGCFEAYGPDEGKHIYDYEHAIKLLMRCTLIRRDVADVDQRIRRSADESAEPGSP